MLRKWQPVPLTNGITEAESEPRPKLRLSMAYFRSVAGVLAEAAEALQHAHDLQILHCDVKPSNLMVDRSGQCRVIDLGLSSYLRAQQDPLPLSLLATGNPFLLLPLARGGWGVQA